MAVHNLKTSWVNGEYPQDDDYNATNKAIRAISGQVDGNDGLPMIGRALPFGYPIKPSDPRFVTTIATGTVTVPASYVLILTSYFRTPSVNYPTITPAGIGYDATYSRIFMLGYAGFNMSIPIQWYFGPGDSITLPAGDYASGFYVSTHTEITPIMMGLTSVAQAYGAISYTVPTGKVFFLTGVLPSASSTSPYTEYIRINGAAFRGVDILTNYIGAYGYQGTGLKDPVPISSGIVITPVPTATTDRILITGFVF